MDISFASTQAAEEAGPGAAPFPVVVSASIPEAAVAVPGAAVAVSVLQPFVTAASPAVAALVVLSFPVRYCSFIVIIIIIIIVIIDVDTPNHRSLLLVMHYPTTSYSKLSHARVSVGV